jgi:hypothetical protein
MPIPLTADQERSQNCVFKAFGFNTELHKAATLSKRLIDNKGLMIGGSSAPKEECRFFKISKAIVVELNA